MSSESSSGSGSSGQPEDEKDTEESTIAKKEEKEIDSVTDYHIEKESEKLQGALLLLAGSSQTGSAKVNVITVAPADILAFSEECEVSKEHAELFLKKFGGDMKSALTAFIRG